jgi:hypothetical protein
MSTFNYAGQVLDYTKMMNKHGSPYDRGGADSYYNRPVRPHYYPEGSYHGEEVTDLTREELDEYLRGYEDNERAGDHKDWS